MIKESTVRALIDETIEGTAIFLVDLKISSGNKISVLVDAIGGLPITDCIKVSRGIEHNLDREEEDFSLDVSSPGLDQPFKVFRQYEKNIGRSLKVTMTDGGVIDAIVVSAEAPKIVFELEKVITHTAVLNEVEKGDHFGLLYADIKESKVNISFS